MKKWKNKEVKDPQLYKFTSVSTLCKVLQEGNGFRFSALNDLNDPYEAIDINEKDLLSFRTLSFSRSHSSTLMWAHYADSFYGCTIKIKKKNYNGIVFQQVKYLSRKERKAQIPECNKLLIKGGNWKYEREHRIILNINDINTEYIFEKDGNYYLKPFIKEIGFSPKIKDSLEYYIVLKKIKEHNDLAIAERKKTKDYIDVVKYKIAEYSYKLIIDKSYDYRKELDRLDSKKDELVCKYRCEICQSKMKKEKNNNG